MAQADDKAQLLQQIADFIGDRPVRLLTRKANSKGDSGVAYETVFPKAPENGILQIFMRADEGEAVAAVNVTQMVNGHIDYWDDVAMGRETKKEDNNG